MLHCFLASPDLLLISTKVVPKNKLNNNCIFYKDLSELLQLQSTMWIMVFVDRRFYSNLVLGFHNVPNPVIQNFLAILLSSNAKFYTPSLRCEFVVPMMQL